MKLSFDRIDVFVHELRIFEIVRDHTVDLEKFRGRERLVNLIWSRALLKMNDHGDDANAGPFDKQTAKLSLFDVW